MTLHCCKPGIKPMVAKHRCAWQAARIIVWHVVLAQMNMGFTRDIAVVAWQACRGDMNMAVEAAVVLTSSASPNKTTTPTHARPPQELPGSGTSTNSSGSSGGSSSRPILWPDHEQGRPHGNGQEEAKMCPHVSLQGLSMAEDAQRSSSLRDDVSLSWKWLAQVRFWAPSSSADVRQNGFAFFHPPSPLSRWVACTGDDFCVQIERVKLGLVKAREGLGSDGLAARAGWVERLFDKKRNFKKSINLDPHW
jgi:hypothetical protein